MKEKKDYYILLSNDDGYDSVGIISLYNALRKIGNVLMVAPDKQNSAVSNALTMQNPLRIVPVFLEEQQIGYRINGTPADCMKLALTRLVDRKPDLVVSGINHGRNTSANIIYSGTISAAYEGLIVGIPSIAISIDSHDPVFDCELASQFSAKIAQFLLTNLPPRDTLLNINIPALPEDQIKGIKVVKSGKSNWLDNYDMRKDPWGRSYFWFAGHYNIDYNGEATDDTALEDGYIAITPLKFDFNDLEKVNSLKILENLS